MYHGKIRLAVCQLKCHPALKVGDIDYLCEPFLPPISKDPYLASLARYNLQIRDLQELCKDEYLKWHAHRVKGILEFLKSLEEIPDIIIFPEGSIPLAILPYLRDFAWQNKKTIFGGTHTLCLTGQWESRYKRLGMDTQTKKTLKKETYIAKPVLPIFHGTKTFFRRKSNPSIYEVTNATGARKGKVKIETIPLGFGKEILHVAPFVCSEALWEYNIVGDFDIAVVCSYNPKQDAFNAFIDQHIKNKKVVVLANDGHFGGSGVFTPVDNRMKTWWWGEERKGRLDQGDGILIVEVDFSNLAPQVGVSNPEPGARLELVGALTYEYGTDSGYEASKVVELAKQKEDNKTQAEIISQILSRELPPIQRVKLAHLHRLADIMTADANWWGMLGKDCAIAGQMDLCGLESRLAKTCGDRLFSILDSGALHDELILGRIGLYLGMCRKQSMLSSRTSAKSVMSRKRTGVVVDRQNEIKEILDFLDDQKQVMCFVIGLNSIGKTSLIRSAIEHSGHQNVLQVSLVQDATPEYICTSLLVQLGYSIVGGIDINSDKIGRLLSDRLPTNSIILIEDAHYCVSHHTWRDDGFPKLFDLLLQIGIDHQCKIIVEAAVEIDLEVTDPSYIKRCRTRGLIDSDAVILLKQQLRRAGLNPKNYDYGQCKQIVKNLGGHPGAIILASEYIEKSTITKVAEDIQKRSGHHLEIVRRIIKGLNLDPDESLILSLLSLARRPVPVKVIARTVEFDGIGVLHDLYKSALVERHENDHVCVTELLKSFADLPILRPDEADIFHEEAAKAFAKLVEGTDPARLLEWSIESRYHAYACGKPELAPDIGDLADGALGACREFIEDREYDKAKPIIERLLKTRRTGETIELAARVYAHLGQCDEALALAKEAHSQPGSNAWILTEVGRCALHFHRTDIAENAVALAIGTGTLNTYMAILEGRIFLKKQNQDLAIKAFQKGVDISEYDGWPHFYLGRELIRKGKIRKAIKTLAKGEEIEANRWRHRWRPLVAIRTQLGIAYLLDGDLANAEIWLKLVAKEGSPEVARAFACIKVKANKGVVTEKALVDLDPRKAKGPFQRCQVHLFRGLFYLSAGIPGKASDEFRLASRADPRNLFVLLRWAKSLIEIARDSQAEGEYEAARNCAEQAKTVAEKVLNFNPRNEAALKVLERLCDEFNVL